MSFGPLLIHTFHQDTAVSQRPTPPPVPLPWEIGSRINALREDEEHIAQPGQAVLLTQSLQKATKVAGLRFRSEYHTALDR